MFDCPEINVGIGPPEREKPLGSCPFRRSRLRVRPANDLPYGLNADIIRSPGPGRRYNEERDEDDIDYETSDGGCWIFWILDTGYRILGAGR